MPQTTWLVISENKQLSKHYELLIEMESGGGLGVHRLQLPVCIFRAATPRPRGGPALRARGRIDNTLHIFQRGAATADNKSRINRCSPRTYRSERPGRCLPARHCPPGLGDPARPSALPPGPPAPSPGRAALTARTHVSGRRGPRTRRQARLPHLPGPRVHAAAAPESEGRGPRCQEPAVAPRQRSPRRPAAAPSSRKRLRSNRFQLLQTKPPGQPAGRGRRAAGRGLTSRPAPSRPIGGRAQGAAQRVLERDRVGGRSGRASPGVSRSGPRCPLSRSRSGRRRPGHLAWGHRRVPESVMTP